MVLTRTMMNVERKTGLISTLGIIFPPVLMKRIEQLILNAEIDVRGKIPLIEFLEFGEKQPPASYWLSVFESV